MTTHEARELWLAANAARADYRTRCGEDNSPEYERLANEADYWLQALLMVRLRDGGNENR